MNKLLAQGICLALLAVLLQRAGSAALHSYTHSLDTISLPGSTANPPTPKDAVGGPPKLVAQDIRAYAETVSRPIFFEGRNYPVMAKPAPAPAPVAPAVVQAAMTVDGIKLLGVILRDGTARALVEVAAQPPSWISVGGGVKLWTIAAIHSESIELKNDSQSVTLSMYAISTDR